MKKLLALFVALTMLFSVCTACGETVPDEPGGPGGPGGPTTHEHVDSDQDGKCDVCNEDMPQAQPTAKPDKIKDGTVLIDFSSEDKAAVITVSEYVKTNGTAPEYVVRSDSEALEVWDVADGIFTIEAKAVCEAVPVYLDVKTENTVQCTVTFTVTVFDGMPTLKASSFDPLALNLDDGSTLEVDLNDYVAYSEHVTDVSYTASTQETVFTVSVEGSTLKITATEIVKGGEIEIKVLRSTKEVLTFTLTIDITDSKIRPEKKGDPTLAADLSTAAFTDLLLEDYIDLKGASDVTYELSLGDDADCIVKEIEGGWSFLAKTAGTHAFTVTVTQFGKTAFTLDGTLTASGEFPAHPVNHNFESGDMTGWTGTGSFETGNFTDNTKTYWATLDGGTGEKGLPYNQEGEYFLTMKQNNANITGTITSTYFRVGESGWVTFMLGSGVNAQRAYISFMHVKSDGTAEEVGRFANTQFKDAWPWIKESNVGTSTDKIFETAHTLQTYKYQFTGYEGEVFYVRLTDLDETSFYSSLVADNITAMETEPEQAVLAMNRRVRYDRETLSNTVENGNFETGTLDGWTVYGNNQIDWSQFVTDAETFWGSFPYYKEGTYFWGCYAMGGINACNYTYTMRSPAFVLGGSGMVTFRLGNARADKNGQDYYNKLYVTVWKYNPDGEDEQIKIFNNYKWVDPGMNIAMTQYYTDLSDYLGEILYFEITDLKQNDNWAGITFDELVTFYEDGEAAKQDRSEAHYHEVPTGEFI